jgi:hypothetical protein
MKAGSACVNIWNQQWPMALQMAVCEWCIGVLDERLQAKPHVFSTPDSAWATRVALARALGDLVGPVRELLGDNVASQRTFADVEEKVARCRGRRYVRKIKEQEDYGAALIAVILVVLPKYTHEATCCVESLKMVLARVVGTEPHRLIEMVPIDRA